MKIKHIDWDKMLEKYSLIKIDIQVIIEKQLLQLNNKKTHNPVKNGQVFEY